MAPKPEYLFLCHNGVKRSPTAVSVARELAQERGLDIEMQYGASNAIDLSSSNIVYLARTLDRYAKICVMQPDIQQKLEKIGLSREKIYCLNIPDEYEKDDPALRTILRKELSPIII